MKIILHLILYLYIILCTYNLNVLNSKLVLGGKAKRIPVEIHYVPWNVACYCLLRSYEWKHRDCKSANESIALVY